MFHKLAFLILMAVFCTAQAFPQGYYWESGTKKKRIRYVTVEAGGGYRMFAGDIQPSHSLFNKLKPGYMAGIRYQPKQHLGFAFQGGGREYRGFKEYAYPGSYEEMTGKLWYGQFIVQFNWIKWHDFNQRSFTSLDKMHKFNSFIATGAGASLYNSSFQTNYLRAQDTLSVSEFEGGSSSGVVFYVPVIFGVRLRLTTQWHLGLEGQYDFYMTDQLDASERGKRRDGMFSLLLKFGFSFGQRTGRLDR